MRKLKARRVELGYTQKQIAEILSVAETQFQAWEASRVIPSFINARKWAKALELDMNSFDDMYINKER